MRNTVMAEGSAETIDLQVALGVLRRDIEFSRAARNIQKKSTPKRKVLPKFVYVFSFKIQI